MFDLPPKRPARPPRQGWWLAPELAAFAALLALSIPFLSGASGSRVEQEVGQRAAQAIEASSPEEHRGHGHSVGGADHVFCGVDVFGTEPRDPKDADEVRMVYGYYFCAIGAEGTTYLDSARSDGPVVVQLSNPPVVQIAGHGEGYEQRVRAMMPDEYEPLCFGGLRNDAVAADVRRRFTDFAGAG
jgi:hypothetical protein